MFLVELDAQVRIYCGDLRRSVRIIPVVNRLFARNSSM